MAKQKNHNIFHYLVTIIVYLFQMVFSSALWLIAVAAGYFIWKNLGSPINLLIGLPLMLVGGGAIINDIYSSFLSIFSPKYNREMCIFCRKTGLIDEIQN